MVATLIRFLMENFTLTLLVCGFIASGIALLQMPRPWPASAVVEALFSYFILFSIAFSNLYNFVAHVFFGEMAARFIGWANSPFQTEVGFASLGFAVVGFLAFRGSHDLRRCGGRACVLFAWIGRRARRADGQGAQLNDNHDNRGDFFTDP